MRRLITNTVLLCLVCAAWAQSLQGTLSQASMTFLGNKAVRKELKLTAQQEAQVKAEIKKLNGTMQTIFSKRPTSQAEASSAREKAGKAQLAMIGRLEKLMTAPQRRRLREIALQQAGPFAMLSPEMKKELALTAAQVRTIETAQKDLVKKVQDLRAQRQQQVQLIPQPKDPKDEKAIAAYRSKVEALVKKFGPTDAKTLTGYKKAAEDKVLAALSSTQKSKWKAALGTPFSLPKK